MAVAKTIQTVASESAHGVAETTHYPAIKDPGDVWNSHLGGYQVLKKWLSYREEAVLGRPLTLEEVRTFTAICRRIAALLALGPELDAQYHAATDRSETSGHEPEGL